MQINSESCVYVESDDVVYGDQEHANTSQWHEAVYYSSPLDVFDNEADYSYPNGDVYTYDSTYYQDPNISDQYSYSGTPQSSSFSGGYVFDSQDHTYVYGAYHYEYYPVYYVYPTYLGNYTMTNLQYCAESFYYDYVPVNLYYVPTFVYYTPTSTYNVSDITYYDDSTHSYQSDEMSFPMEQNFDPSQEFNCKLNNFVKGSLADTLGNCNEIVGEGITTCYLFYGEYPQTLNDAPVDDEATSMSSNENLENNIVSNEAEVNENITVNEESYSIEKNLCEDDVDRNLIKKISSMNIDDVKEDIDDNYENAKAFVYSEVLKGYTEIKNQLEELDWECHSLEDILEEEEPESDSSEMNFNENAAEDLENITSLADEDEESLFASASCSEESQVDSNEKNLVDDHQIMIEETQPSADLLDVEEKDEIDPFLELCLITENLLSGSLDSIEGDHLPVASSAVQGKDKTGPFSEQSLSKEELHSRPVNFTEEHHPPVDESVAEENYKMETVPQLPLREELDSRSRSSLKELNTDMASQDRGEGELHSTPDMLAPAAPIAIQRKKRFSGLRKFFARMCCCVKKKS